jgi:hypothetical protein
MIVNETALAAAISKTASPVVAFANGCSICCTSAACGICSAQRPKPTVWSWRSTTMIGRRLKEAVRSCRRPTARTRRRPARHRLRVVFGDANVERL